jgi:Protein of unknown function (DUF1682)
MINQAKAKNWFVPFTFRVPGRKGGERGPCFRLTCLDTDALPQILDHRLKAHIIIFEKQFSSPTAGDDLTADGYSDFFNFSTGRRNVASLHTVFRLRPRHDLLQLAYQFARGFFDLLYAPKDEITLDFKLHPTTAVPDFVWALVVKGESNSIRNERWDLVSTPLRVSLSRTLFYRRWAVLSAQTDIHQDFREPADSPQHSHHER